MFLAVAGALTFTASVASAQDQPAPTEQATQLSAEDLLKGTGEDVPFHQQIKSYFIQGGPGFMSAIILCLILGLALAIERILYLSFAKTNTKKLITKVEDALREGGVEKAKDVMSAVTPRALSPASSTMDFSTMTKVSTWSRRGSPLPAVSR